VCVAAALKRWASPAVLAMSLGNFETEKKKEKKKETLHGRSLLQLYDATVPNHYYGFLGYCSLRFEQSCSL
jgi:hypothetical protein